MAKDWDPGTYERFRGLRLRPALDLLRQIGALPKGDIVDLGCGAGAVAEALRAHSPKARLVGVDSSETMLGEARKDSIYDLLTKADAARWEPDRRPALIFSNALCHWIPEHESLFPRLVSFLKIGGVLAVQMPRQFLEPSHQLLRDTAVDLIHDRFDFGGWVPPVHRPGWYHQLLSPFGEVSVWETTYQQHLSPVPVGHPVRHFTQSTAMRPIADKLTDAELDRFIAVYDAALSKPYPLQDDGSVLMAFRRVFFVLSKKSADPAPRNG